MTLQIKGSSNDNFSIADVSVNCNVGKAHETLERHENFIFFLIPLFVHLVYFVGNLIILIAANSNTKRFGTMGKHDNNLVLIEIALQEFNKQFLLADATPQCLTALWKAAQECRTLNLTRGDPKTWAAAIAYAFARMNFLLDDKGPQHIERSKFFDFFAGCSRSTVTQKATATEKALNCRYGHPDFCLPEVVDAIPRFVQLPNGMIVPEKSVDREPDGKCKIEIELLNEEESRKLEEELIAREREKEEEKRRARNEKLRKKREKESKNQPALFDFGDI